MVVTIYTDTFEQAQAVYDLCCISNLDTYDFIELGENDEYGIDIVVTTIDHKFALQRVQSYVYDHFTFEDKKND